MTAETRAGGTLPTRRARKAVRRRLSIIGVLGELLITAGVIVLLFLGWQLWLNDIVVGGQQNAEAAELIESWNAVEGAGAPTPAEPGEPVVREEPDYGDKFGAVIVPRWGDDYKRSVAQGVGLDVLNHIGVGHYPGTQMPGEVGNFAVAAHRTTWGAPFHNLHELRVGDHIYVQTEDGWYSYIFRTLEYVLPTAVGVLDPVPMQSELEPTDRIMTMTTCNPMFSAAERLIAFSVFDKWYPKSEGPPAEIADTVSAEGS